jgi:hypothetical protein
MSIEARGLSCVVMQDVDWSTWVELRGDARRLSIQKFSCHVRHLVSAFAFFVVRGPKRIRIPIGRRSCIQPLSSEAWLGQFVVLWMLYSLWFRNARPPKSGALRVKIRPPNARLSNKNGS